MEINIKEKELNLLPPADLADEIVRLQDELILERDRNLRTLADFKNYRRRIEREGNKIANDSKREIMLSLLYIADDLEKALQSNNNSEDPLIKGVQNINQKLTALLESNGVFPINSVGAPFDHNFHEAVAMGGNDEMEAGTVIDELRKGYFLNNELLRAAQVRVSGL